MALGGIERVKLWVVRAQVRTEEQIIIKIGDDLDLVLTAKEAWELVQLLNRLKKGARPMSAGLRRRAAG